MPTLACCFPVGEKPFAGMRHAQIIYHVTTLLAHPQIPEDAPSQLKVLVWFGLVYDHCLQKQSFKVFPPLALRR